MNHKGYLPLAEIVQALHTLCQKGRTGVLRIITDNNHTAQFGLEGGRIVFVRYRIRRGVEALEQIKLIQTGQFSFEEGKSIGNDEARLPGNSGILFQLGHPNTPAPRATAPAVPPTPQNSTPPPSLSLKEDFSTAAKIALEDALTEHIGPMAGIVCRNVLAQASDIGEAITMMKAKIPDPERAEQFERNVMSRTLI